MKRLFSILAVVLLVGTIAVSAMAFGPGGGRGGSMMYGRGGDPENCPSYRGVYDNLPAEQREQLNELHKKFYDETTQLRKDLWDKRNELRSILDTATPDIEKAKAVQNEISIIRSTLAEKQLELAVEVRKIAPDARFGRGPGHMKGFGRGKGGYGPGACWR